MLHLIDAHDHLLDAPAGLAGLSPLVAAAQAAGIGTMLVNSVAPHDWAPLAALARRHPAAIIPFFGVHPWQALPHGWEGPLARALARAPRPCGVGECGLDRKKSPLPLAAQETALTAQLGLAARFRLPLALHCLGAAPELLALLWPRRGRGATTPVLLHSFGDGPAAARRFIDHGAFFSFSWAAFRPGRRRARELLRLTPRERLLLETDAPGATALAGGTRDALPGLPAVYHAAAAELGVSVAALAERLAENLRAFLSR